MSVGWLRVQLLFVFLVGWCASFHPVSALRIKHLHENQLKQQAQAQALEQTQMQTVALSPQFSRALDVYQGFNFKKDKQSPVGYITSLNINGIPIRADWSTIMDPTSPSKSLPDQVGVLNHYLWESGSTNAMYFSCQISVHDKQIISAMLLSKWKGSIPVTFQYVVYEYDPIQKKYFKSNYADKPLDGLLEANGDDYNIAIADAPSTEVQSPKNYVLQLGIKPSPKEQVINLATGVGKNIVKAWGVK